MKRNPTLTFATLVAAAGTSFAVAQNLVPNGSFEAGNTGFTSSYAYSPSDNTDELSFGQGSTAGRPFTASDFARVTLIDEPFDRIEYDGGHVPAGGQVTLRFVVSQPDNMHEAFIAQRPGRPVVMRTRNPIERLIAWGHAGAVP